MPSALPARTVRPVLPSRLLVALAFGVSTLAACSDSSVDPRVTSPVGRYELVGCTYGADTASAHVETNCSTGGTAHHEWTSGFVLLDENGTATRSLVETASALGSGYSMTDTSVVVGSWTLEAPTVKVAWSGFSYDAGTVYTRVGDDLIREAGVWNESLLFWFRRTP